MRSPGVTTCSSAPCRPHTPWFEGWMDNAFVAIVPTRPCPLFGRPVHRRDGSHRFRPGASPQALRIPPRGGHPALLDSHRGQRGVTPAFGYGALHPSASGTSTHLSTSLPSAHYERSDSARRLFGSREHEHRPIPAQGSLRHAHHRCDHSVSNHLVSPRRRFPTLPLSAPSTPSSRAGLRRFYADSPVHPAESSSSSYGLVTHLRLLPTSPRGDAVIVGYGPESVCPGRTFTFLLVCACRRTWLAGFAGDMDREETRSQASSGLGATLDDRGSSRSCRA